MRCNKVGGLRVEAAGQSRSTAIGNYLVGEVSFLGWFEFFVLLASGRYDIISYDF